jgi:hypothetical protein
MLNESKLNDTNSMNLIDLENVHSEIDFTKKLKNVWPIRGKLKYYHYNCDFFDDIGWGCGYRTTQMICAWINEQILNESKHYNIDNIIVNNVPSVLDIQRILVESGDKNKEFYGSKEWMGVFDTSIVIDSIYNVPCKIIHCAQGDLPKYTDSLIEHFRVFSSPIAVGGNVDNSSKGFLGIGTGGSDSKPHFLVTNPHYVAEGLTKKSVLFEDHWIEWRSVDSFESESFYNLCLPQIKAKL